MVRYGVSDSHRQKPGSVPIVGYAPIINNPNLPFKMKGRATIIHRQGHIDIVVHSVPMDEAPRTFSNLVAAMKNRAKSAWGVRFDETPDSITAIWPASPRLPDGWSESVRFIPEE